jgi:hypothetical protein
LASTRDNESEPKFHVSTNGLDKVSIAVSDGVGKTRTYDTSMTDLTSAEGYFAVTTKEGTGWWSSTDNYTYNDLKSAYEYACYHQYSATGTDTYTTKRKWEYYDKDYNMYCEHCGKSQYVRTEDFRLHYVCDECKSSVPLLTVLRKYFNTINW